MRQFQRLAINKKQLDIFSATVTARSIVNKNLGIMSNSRESYRKNLSMTGLLFIGGIEHEMQVKNVSISGLLVTIEPIPGICDERDIFLIMKESSLVDIYIRKLNLAGEAEVVRVEMDGKNILIGMEFKQVSYDAENLLYKRKAYRKSMTSPGQVLISKTVYDFMTRNVSVDGLMIRIPEQVELQRSMVVEFKFDKLHLFGECIVIWFEYDDNGGTLLGLEYQHMEKGDIQGIPRFYDQ